MLSSGVSTIDAATLTSMSAAVAHRGPDDDGTWTDEAAGIALVHRRLAIIDLSTAGAQPMHSSSQRWVIAYNGEIYNHRDLRVELEQRGVRFRGHSDTEVLVAALDEWGVTATLGRLDGMYAFAAWDRRSRALTLVRDPLGEKPLYYGWAGSDFIFGSELGALLAHPYCPREVDQNGLGALLRYKYIPAPLTILKGVHKLASGQMATLMPGPAGRAPAVNTYWDAVEIAHGAFHNRRSLTAEDAVDELEGRLLASVAQRTIADVPVGAFLSGGIDSSAVVAMLTQLGGSTRTFSIGFRAAEFDEAPYAREVARHLGTDHTELYMGPEELLACVPRMPDVYSEPFADSSQLPTTIISQLARDHVKVVLSGDGGDELFGGYGRYGRAESEWAMLERYPAAVRRAMAEVMRRAGMRFPSSRVPDLSVIPRRLRGRNLGIAALGRARTVGAQSLPGLYRDIVSDWVDPAQVMSKEPGTDPMDWASWQDRATPRECMMLTDLVSYLPEDILVKVDRASMAVGLESRIPLLQRSLVEFSFGLPPDLKYRDGIEKYALRAIAYRHIPEHLLKRPKMGFGVPLDEWLRGPLREWADELLRPDRLTAEGYFSPQVVSRIWQAHLARRGNWSRWLWSILMFQAWHDRWLQASAAPSL